MTGCFFGISIEINAYAREGFTISGGFVLGIDLKEYFMNKNFFFSVMPVIVLVFGISIVGCEDSSTDTKVIDAKFRGKWELLSFEYQGTTYTLPATFMDTQINSGGYEITENTVKTYANRVVTQNINGIYSEGNSFFNSAGQSGFTMQVNGNNATIILFQETDNCIKVTKFSWE